MKIPFGKTFNITPAQLRDGVAQGLVDGYIDYDGSYRSRLGLASYQTVTADAIDGIYVDTIFNEYVVAGGVVYVNGTACSGSPLKIGNNCVFAEDTTYVYVAHGGRIAKVDPVAKTVSLIASASAPNFVTHVVYLQGYLLANGIGGAVGDTFYTGPYTLVEYLDTWEVYNNESLPDGCKAVMEDGQLVYNFGSKSVEVSINDGVTPWGKYHQSYIPYGIHAANSVAKADNTFYWLGVADNALRVMKMKGGSAVTLSTPYDSIINTLGTTTDAYGYTCGIEGHTFYVLQFPTEELTLVYHLQSDAWYRWAYYDVTTATYKAFLGCCHAYNANTNKNLMGIRNSGIVASMEGFTDLGDLIRFELTSGNVKGDTMRIKRGSRLRFQLQRGTTTSVTDEPYFRWQRRDDGGSWSPERNVSLGLKGHYDYIGQLDRLPVYRERQHRLIFTESTCQFVFVEAEDNSKAGDD